MKKLLLALGIIVVVVVGTYTTHAGVGSQCTTCRSNGANATLGVNVVNPETCESDLGNNCPTGTCSHLDYLKACPLIELLPAAGGGTPCSPTTRSISVCDRWMDLTANAPLTSCFDGSTCSTGVTQYTGGWRCYQTTMTVGTTYNPTSLCCDTTAVNHDYQYQVRANDITHATGVCLNCERSCFVSGCTHSDDCNVEAIYDGCTINVP